MCNQELKTNQKQISFVSLVSNPDHRVKQSPLTLMITSGQFEWPTSEYKLPPAEKVNITPAQNIILIAHSGPCLDYHTYY